MQHCCLSLGILPFFFGKQSPNFLIKILCFFEIYVRVCF